MRNHKPILQLTKAASMRLTSSHQSLRSGLIRLCRWGTSIALCVMSALPGATSANGATSQLTPRDLHIDIPAESLFGSLPVNRNLTVSVQISEPPAGRSEPLVALFETQDSAPYSVPLEIDHDRHRFSATVDLGRLSSTMGSPPKATALRITIGRRQGLQVEPLVRRTVIITIAMPGYADHQAVPADLTDYLANGSRGPMDHPTDMALLDGRVEEEELLEQGGRAQQEGYWKMLHGLIRRQMQQDSGPGRQKDVRQTPGIGFRLYANGEAQLIEVERSSGDLDVDRAALLAVVNAHPFPPFPPGTQDTHVDVHVEVPPLAR